MTINENFSVTSFSELDLAEPIHKALKDVGYKTPTPIQARTIPHLLEGRDMVGQAQTGTGKTAAFALPILSKIDPKNKDVQVLVLTPTRELAIQVADGFANYSKYMLGLKVLPIYGGQDYGIQLRGLKQGVQVVVGTPGRVMDHMRRGTLNISNLSCLILDEADEMLRMGFIDDVEWILEQTPSTRQTALFSATMPRPIRNIASRHLNDPKEIIIETRTTAADSIRQRYLVIPGAHKTNALIRILEMEEFDGVMVFVKTKAATVEVTEKLVAHGYAACALNGDLSQALRERTVNMLKKGRLDILVATDVAARGLDVERISHVFNFDAPFDTESYVHRIGRTGRAGRNGEAILFLTPNDRRILRNIGKATKQKIEPMDPPSVKAINQMRIKRFKEQITETLASNDLSFFKNLIETYAAEHELEQLDVSAAIAQLLQGNKPLLLKEEPKAKKFKSHTTSFNADRPQRGRTQRKAAAHNHKPEQGMERYRVEVGDSHDVRPSNIVGAIANEAGIKSEYIGRIHIFDHYSTVDLPEGMPRKTLRMLKKVWVCKNQLNISKENQNSNEKSSKETPEKPQRPAEEKIKNKTTNKKRERQKARKKKQRQKKNKGKPSKSKKADQQSAA